MALNKLGYGSGQRMRIDCPTRRQDGTFITRARTTTCHWVVSRRDLRWARGSASGLPVSLPLKSSLIATGGRRISSILFLLVWSCLDHSAYGVGRSFPPCLPFPPLNIRPTFYRLIDHDRPIPNRNSSENGENWIGYRACVRLSRGCLGSRKWSQTGLRGFPTSKSTAQYNSRSGSRVRGLGGGVVELCRTPSNVFMAQQGRGDPKVFQAIFPIFRRPVILRTWQSTQIQAGLFVHQQTALVG